MTNHTSIHMNTTDEDIRKKEKKLDRAHWMCRIQKFVFGIDAPTFYMGYCPFFWMTWLAVVSFPIVLSARLIWGIFDVLMFKQVGKASDYMSNIKAQRQEDLEKVPLLPGYEVMIHADALLKIYCKRKKKIEHHRDYLSPFDLARGRVNGIRMLLWFDQNPNWRKTHLPHAIELKAKIEAEAAADEEAKKNRARRFRALVNRANFCGRLIFKVIFPAAILGVAYGVYRLLYVAYTRVHAVDLLGAFTIICALAAGVVFARIFLDAFDTFVGVERLWLFLGKFGLVCAAPVKLIIAIYSFLRDTVKMTYKAECPLIIWGDETGKIQKREKV